jgi:hypothetical protein
VEISELLGFYVNPEVIIPLLMSDLVDKEFKSLARSLISILIVFTQVIKRIPQRELEPYMKPLVDMLNTADFIC